MVKINLSQIIILCFVSGFYIQLADILESVKFMLQRILIILKIVEFNFVNKAQRKPRVFNHQHEGRSAKHHLRIICVKYN